GRLRAVLDPVAHPIGVEHERPLFGAGVVVPEDLDELAVARRTGVGHHDAICRGLRLAGAPQADMYSQSQTSLRERCAREEQKYTGRAVRTAFPAASGACPVWPSRRTASSGSASP